MRPKLIVCIGVLFLLSGFASAQKDRNQFFTNFPYRTKLLTDADLVDVPNWTDYYAVIRGYIFGRHGRVFTNERIQEYVESTPWYEPNPNFSNSMLNDIERQNLDLVRKWEAKGHEIVEPGDLRFWRDRYIPDHKLEGAKLGDVHIMRAEIEAIHGRRFDHEPTLQAYFEARYWYKPAEKYDPRSLNEFQRKNLAKLEALEAKLRGQRITPGSYISRADKLLTADDLKGLTLHDLRLLRNEVYALRGARFQTWWLGQHFAAQDWYEPLPEGKVPQLTRVDHLNIATILRRERELHESLLVAPIEEAQVTGMRSDDIDLLRHEIEARRGKLFREKWLQSYFSSLPWYRSDKSYKQSSLSAVERNNVAALKKYAAAAREVENLAEG